MCSPRVLIMLNLVEMSYQSTGPWAYACHFASEHVRNVGVYLTYPAATNSSWLSVRSRHREEGHKYSDWRAPRTTEITTNPTFGGWQVSLSLSLVTVPRLHLQAGPAGLPAAHRPVLPPAQHLQQSQGRGAEPGGRAGRLWGKFNIRLKKKTFC